MKLILTENQYKLLEAILDEAATPMSTKIEQGGFIQVVFLVGDNERTDTLEISKLHGGGKYATGVNKSGSYLINIGGSLKTDANTFTLLKGGEYKEGGKTDGGKVTGGEVVGGSKLVVKNVTQVNISDANKNVVDKIITDLGEDKEAGDDEVDADKQARLDKRAEHKKDFDRREKEIYDELMSDPTVRKAFSHQPKILNGLLNFGKAKGIIPAQKLMSKYLGGYELGDKQSDKEKSKFNVGKTYMIKNGNTSINIQHGDNTFFLPSGFSAKVRYNNSGALKGKKDGQGYYIKIGKNLKDDIYRGDLYVEFEDIHSGFVKKSEKITFEVTGKDI